MQISGRRTKRNKYPVKEFNMKNKTIQAVTAKQLRSVIPRAETVSVKVSHDHLVTLDNLAAQCGNLQDVYTGILVNSNNQK